MVMPASGAISVSNIQTELGLGQPLDLNNTRVRRLASAGSTGAVSMSNMYGQSEYISGVAWAADIVFPNTTSTSVSFTVSTGSFDGPKVVAFCFGTSYQQNSIENITATIGGVSAGVYRTSSSTQDINPTWLVAAVPGGTTATIVINTSNSRYWSACFGSVYQITGKTNISVYGSAGDATLTYNGTVVYGQITMDFTGLFPPAGQTYALLMQATGTPLQPSGYNQQYLQHYGKAQNFTDGSFQSSSAAAYPPSLNGTYRLASAAFLEVPNGSYTQAIVSGYVWPSGYMYGSSILIRSGVII